MERIKIGLALSGGGLRGAAHVGLLQYLDEMNLIPDIISGTSAGAIVGALYAAGNKPEQILEVFKNTKLFQVSKFTWAKPGILDTDRFDTDLLPYFHKDDFDALNIKLVVTASNLLEGTLEVFEKGSVIRAILASSAFPGIFSPVKIEEDIYADGGIFNNLPADQIYERCDKVIGMNVFPAKAIEYKELGASFNVLLRAMDLTIYEQSVKNKSYCHVYICPDQLGNYNMFATSRINEIFDIGYSAAKSNRDSLLRLLENSEHQKIPDV